MSNSSRIVSGFWRRVGAYALDTFLLGAIGCFLGLFFYSDFSQMGAWGLLIGLTISIFYFGLLNSALGKGQTLGKRYLGIEVVNREGHHLSPDRSILRYLIFASPFYLCGVLNSGSVPTTSWTATIIGVVVFSVGGTIAYLYIFNRRTRQSLHDLAVGSYVVRTEPKGDVIALPIWKGHIIAIALLFLVTLGLAFAGTALSHANFFKNLLAVQEAIQSSGKVNSVSVMEGVNSSSFNGNFHSAKVLTVKAHWIGKTIDPDAAQQIAAIVLKQYPDVMQDDLLSIQIWTGYNIGIASSSFMKSDPRSPQEWEKLSSSANP